MTFFEQLIEQLKLAEGCSLIPYEDSTGNLTIGYGHVLSKPIHITVAHKLLVYDTLDAIEDLDQNKPWWKDLPLEARLVVADMCFNLGWPKYSKFVRFWAALEKRDYQTAADELVDSLWYRQVKTRGIRLELMLRSVA